MSSAFADLVAQTVRIPNPQRALRGVPGEKVLADFLCKWLTARGIQCECDLHWGVHGVLTGPDGPGAPGVLLAAHMDSDHLDERDLKNVRVEGDTLVCPGLVGLDCKTGIAIALSVLERLSKLPGAWQVHVLFTVGEESGQKGAIRAPLPRLLAGRVRFGFVIDRMTDGSGAPRGEDGKPVRHAVSKYKGLPLLEPGSGPELLRHLHAGCSAADPIAVASGALPLIESPNCADAIELRGRWDTEVLAPACASSPPPALAPALAHYHAAHEKVLDAMATCRPDDRIGSMNGPPRINRYQAMRGVYDALHGGYAEKLDPALCFSVVNLSYNYDDARGHCDLVELDRTARILVNACKSAFANNNPKTLPDRPRGGRA